MFPSPSPPSMAEISHDQGSDDEKLARRRRFANTDGLSDEELKSIFSNYGWIYIVKFINSSDNVIHFYNPYQDMSGDIDPGKSNESGCQGYLPLWSYDKKYEIEYYNTNLKQKNKIRIKDLEGDWLGSFYQEECDEDIREMRPPLISSVEASVTIIILNSGYDVIADGKRRGGMLWQPI